MFQIYHVPLYSRFADLAEESDVLKFYTQRKIFVSPGNILVVTTFLAFNSLYRVEACFKAVLALGGIAMIVIASKGDI